MQNTETYLTQSQNKINIDNNKLDFFNKNEKLVYDFIYRNKKYWYAFESLEDMKQELLMVTWMNLDKYNYKNSFSTFLNKVLLNCCKDKIKSLNRSKRTVNKNYVLESEIEDGFDRVIDNDSDMYETFIKKWEYEQISEISRDIIDNNNSIRAIKNKYNIGRKKIIKIIKKDINKIKEVPIKWEEMKQ